MSITVGAIYEAFPNFDQKDMIKLCNGNKNINGKTVVPLQNIAEFGDKNLSIFAAKNEGTSFTSLLDESEEVTICSAANVELSPKTQDKDKRADSAQIIPMGKSIFDIAGYNKKNA